MLCYSLVQNMSRQFFFLLKKTKTKTKNKTKEYRCEEITDEHSCFISLSCDCQRLKRYYFPKRKRRGKTICPCCSLYFALHQIYYHFRRMLLKFITSHSAFTLKEMLWPPNCCMSVIRSLQYLIIYIHTA